jgi:DNA-binding CsgD family transcriptional regulator
MLQQRPPLTQRELEILHLMADGLTDKEIAARLEIAPGTVSNHVAFILAKLGAPRRANAVALAFRLGLMAGPWAVLHGQDYRIDEQPSNTNNGNHSLGINGTPHGKSAARTPKGSNGALASGVNMIRGRRTTQACARTAPLPASDETPS